MTNRAHLAMRRTCRLYPILPILAILVLCPRNPSPESPSPESPPGIPCPRNPDFGESVAVVPRVRRDVVQNAVGVRVDEFLRPIAFGIVR